MRFGKYMESWLYGDDGYYRKFRGIGREGDFYTAVSSSRFFGASIANYLYRLIKEQKIPRDVALIEIGADRGYLISDMIDWLNSCDPTLLESMSFGVVERESKLWDAQREYIQKRVFLGDKIEFFRGVEEIEKKSIFFISNEIFDAFPCELFKDGAIATVDSHQISWQDAPEEILDFAKRHRLTKGEIALGYEDFAKRVSKSAKRVEFISFDYGERYVRNDFSIRIYKEHQTFPLFDDEVNLESLYQNSDITFDVNFEHTIEAFKENGLELVDYKTQARALIEFGIMDILQQYYDYAPYESYLREANRVKTLIAPTIMGDRFKMIHFRK